MRLLGGLKIYMDHVYSLLQIFSDNGRHQRPHALHLRPTFGGHGAADGFVRAGGAAAVVGGGAHAGAAVGGRQDEVPDEQGEHVRGGRPRGKGACQVHAADA